MRAAIWALTTALALGTSGGAAAVTVYRSVGPDGTVYFTGHPVAGAERVEVELNTGLELTPAGPAPGAGPARAAGEEAAAAGRPDYTLAFASLEDGEVVWNDARRLELRLRVEPPLDVEAGHRLEVYLDGVRRAGPVTSPRVVIEDVDRGTHAVQARIVSAAGDTLATTPLVTVIHKQHSVPTAR